MGYLDYISNFCTVTSTRRGKRKVMQVFMILSLSSVSLVFLVSFLKLGFDLLFLDSGRQGENGL